MCFDDMVAKTHECTNACPVCYILTPENALQLLSGARIQLGIVDLFVETAQIGCHMCQLLCNVWDLNQEIFQPGAEVSVRRQEDAPPGLLWALLFEISEPLDFEWMDKGTGSYRDKKFKSWAVPFGVYTKGSEWLDHFITMRPPNPSVAHNDVFDTFRVSLETCLSDHKECEKPNPYQLPTRLLLLDEDVPDRVFVHECKPGERGSYVALSYCWGATSQFKLLKTNLDDLSKKGIEVGTLPKTIKDSIIATRKLGVKYLWIDSLCIIQDSIEDKDKELVEMASIYKNATITISAAAATDCGQGFLEDRSDVQLHLDRSICLPFLSTAEEENCEIIDWVYLCPNPHMGHKVKRFSEEAINTRAWTYQESTLASRLLIFGSGPPQWHCKERWKIYGLNIHPENLPNQECSSGFMKITIEDGSIVPDQTLKYFERPEPPKDDIGSWPTWLPLLENYSHRALSYPTDKLPALSALAAEHQSPQNGTYAAGLWNASLPRGLLWRRSSSNSAVVHHVQQQAHPFNWLRTRLFSTSSSIKLQEPSAWLAQYVAPTWSPMSCTEPICFESATTQKEDEFHTSLVEINDIHVELTTNLNPFGGLKFGYLNVTAPMCSMSWQELTANFVIIGHGEPFAYWDFIILDDSAFFEEMCEKYGPSFNPQTLADRSIQHPTDNDDYSVVLSDAGTRIRMPVIWEPASRECPDTDTPFTSVLDVKQAVFNALLLETPVTGSSNSTESPVIVDNDECEFWLLEVERSMSPAGLVLKRVHGNIFARVGYFGMNRCLDPEIVYLPGGVQVRGPKNWSWDGPEGKSSWNDMLTRRRIYLV